MRLLMSLVCSRSRKPLSLQCRTKRLGIRDNCICVDAAANLPFQERRRQRGDPREMVIRDDQWGGRLSDSFEKPRVVRHDHPALRTGERFVRTRDQDISALFDQLLELSAGDQNHRVDRVIHEDRLWTMHIRGFTDIANGLWE